MKCLILLAIIFKWILKITSLPKILINSTFLGREVIFNSTFTCKINKLKPKPVYKGPFPLRAWKKTFFVCFIDFFCARFNRRLIKETKNALFHARSGNGP